MPWPPSISRPGKRPEHVLSTEKLPPEPQAETGPPARTIRLHPDPTPVYFRQFARHAEANAEAAPVPRHVVFRLVVFVEDAFQFRPFEPLACIGHTHDWTLGCVHDRDRDGTTRTRRIDRIQNDIFQNAPQALRIHGYTYVQRQRVLDTQASPGKRRIHAGKHVGGNFAGFNLIGLGRIVAQAQRLAVQGLQVFLAGFFLAGVYPVGMKIAAGWYRGGLGQALGFLDVPSGPYLMLPFLGPSTVRDTVGLAVDSVLNPLFWLVPDTLSGFGVTSGRVVNETTVIIDDKKALDESAIDPYESIRDFYHQSRAKKIRE